MCRFVFLLDSGSPTRHHKHRYNVIHPVSVHLCNKLHEARLRHFMCEKVWIHLGKNDPRHIVVINTNEGTK